MHKVYIIAEIGNTHEGSIGLAKLFAKSASECGVDAIKFQTHIFDEESLDDAPNPPYFQDETRRDYFERTAFSKKEWSELKRYCEIELKVDFLSTPFSIAAVDLLESINVSSYKVPSGDVSNTLFLKKIALTQKKVYLSTGMSGWDEIDLAVSTLQKNGCKELVILQCTSKYPCPPELSGINILDELQNRYSNIEIGYSDHTIGPVIPLAAIMRGATVIEKHFTLSNKMYGSDAKNATEPKLFEELVSQIRILEKAINNPIDKDELNSELLEMKNIFEKSIVSASSLKKGQIIDLNDLAFKKPGDGIKASLYKQVIGKKMKKNISNNCKFDWSYFS